MAHMYGSRIWVMRIGDLYIQPVYTGTIFDTHTYRPYVRVSKNAPVCTGRKYTVFRKNIPFWFILQLLVKLTNLHKNSEFIAE